MKPLLSVIIPNYNKSIYLKECLEKVINQTYRPLEVVIVDDCSTDNSRDIINDFSKKYVWIKGIFLNKNGGVSYARNIGVKNASGDYITFLDSDDYYVNVKKLELEMDLLLTERQKDKKYKVVFSNLIAVDRVSNTLWKYHTRSFFKGRTLKKIILERRNIQLPRDFCIERKCHEKIGGFDEKSDLYEDTDYLIRLAEIADFCCTNELGTAYRITGSGLSSVSQRKHKKAISQLRMKYKDGFTKVEWFWIETRFRWQEIYDNTKQCVKMLLKKQQKDK